MVSYTENECHQERIKESSGHYNLAASIDVLKSILL